MSNLVKLLMVSITAAIFAVPTIVNAEELRSVSCSVRIDYLWNDQIRVPYTNNFVINPGVVFEHDFSDRIHFRYFNASTSLVSGKTVVSINYYNEQGAFWYVDFRPMLTLSNGGDQEETVSGRSSHYSENGGGEFTTDYTLACRRLKL